MNYKIDWDGIYSSIELTSETPEDNPHVYRTFQEAKRELHDYCKSIIQDWQDVQRYLRKLRKEDIR